MDRFRIKFWNGKYYCQVVFPDGVAREFKSDVDLTFTEWKAIAVAAWEEHQNPEPEPGECQCPKCRATFVCENR
jgi:hypothetical protein